MVLAMGKIKSYGLQYRPGYGTDIGYILWSIRQALDMMVRVGRAK